MSLKYMKSSWFYSIFLLVITTQIAESYVDLFLDANETKTLLGLPGNLFYVFGGELRQNSISYIIEIPHFKDKVELNWKTTGFNQKNFVKYKFNLTDYKNITDQTNKLSISSTGLVPSSLSKFNVQVNCTNNATEFDFDLNVYFELNNTQQNDLQQLFQIPPLNFTIKYRKSCVKNKNTLRFKSLAQSSSNYLVAYIIIGTLLSFALLIASSGIIMFFHNKIKHRKLHSKYESLHARLNKQNLAQNSKPINKDEEEEYEKQVEHFKNKMYTKNIQIKKNKNLYVNKKSKQIEMNSDRQDEQIDENQNIYESVQEAPVNMTTNTINNINSEQQLMISRKVSKNLLNLTTNTIQSTYNTNISTSNLITSKSNQNFNRTSVESCTKFRRDQIEFENTLVEGTFSRIYEGKLILNDVNDTESDNKESVYDNFDTSNMQQKRTSRRLSKCFNIDKDKGYIRVLIKTVNDHASLEQTDLMLKESAAFRGLKHKNLNPIIGLCIEPDHHTLALFPYNEMGNLKQHLNSLRQAKAKTSECVITTQELLYIMLQMLKALNYLHGKRIIHKDIATRNCWLDGNFSLKLADCALARDLFPQDYHCLANNENRPICWMAFESLKENVFNSKTDIWSAGVFMWECFSLAAQPYEGIDPFDLITYLSESDLNRLGKPLKCPNELFELYSNCWNKVPNMRPSLKEIFYSMHKLYSNYDNYV